MSEDKQNKLNQLKKKLAFGILRILIIFSVLAIYFFIIRFLIPNEQISRFFIFPAFLIAIFLVIRIDKRMNRIKKEIQTVKRSPK